MHDFVLPRFPEEEVDQARLSIGFEAAVQHTTADVPVHEERLVRTAAWLFGGLYIGLQLPLSARTQPVWTWTRSLHGDARPGSWGGHAVNIVRYSPATLTCATWGKLQDMTWSFWDRYCDEAYAIVSTDFLQQGKSPAGFDLATLQSDLQLVTGH